MKNITSRNTQTFVLFAPVIFIVAALAVMGIVLLRSYEQNSILPGIHLTGSFDKLPVVEPATPVHIAVIDDPKLPDSIDTIPATSRIALIRQMPPKSQALGQSVNRQPAAPVKVPEPVKEVVENALENGHVAGDSTVYTPPVPPVPPVPQPVIPGGQTTNP